MPRPPLPRLGPNPTPITEYLAHHPEATMMSLAKAVGLHYDTIHAAESGRRVPHLVTVLKLQMHAGIPVMAWAKTSAVKRELEMMADATTYNRKAAKYRAKKRAADPAYAAKDAERFKRKDARRAAARRGELIAPVPMSPLKASLKGLPSGALERVTQS